MSENNFLPICKKDMEERGWEQLDFVYISGDAYVDHPSFGHAIITRLLEAHGFKVGIIAQPDWKDKNSITILGEPRLGFLVSAGNMDSMVNHYSVSKKHRRTDAYTPGGVMGKLEDHIMQIAALTGDTDVNLNRKALIVMCADNGVVEEGVTQTGQEVTAIVAENFLTCNTSAAIMCKKAGVDIFPIDIGMAADTKVPRYKTANGTANMTKGPAMTRMQALQAILTGIHQVKRMFLAVGKEVTYLKRERMGTLCLDENLKPGEYRLLTEEEIENVRK